MAKDPAFLFYHNDFLVGTSFMKLEEVGAYIKLLCFLADKGSVTEKEILMKIPDVIWRNICCKFDKDDFGFYNKRLRFEVEKRKKYCQSRRENKSYDKHMSKHMENENIDVNEDVIKNVIKDLNFVLGTSYKPNSKQTNQHIHARLAEGFTLDDFKKVHRTMFKNWEADPKMCKFLRPQTLYSPKFESYLNMKEGSKNGKNIGNNRQSSEYAGIETEIKV